MHIMRSSSRGSFEAAPMLFRTPCSTSARVSEAGACFLSPLASS